MKRCDPVDTAESADPDLDRSIQRTARELKAMFNSKGIQCFRPVSNRGPFACEANVITTTLREHKNVNSCMFRIWQPNNVTSTIVQPLSS